MNTPKRKITARLLALAASVAVSIGVWVGVAKPPAQNNAVVTAATVPDPTFASNDNFLGADANQALAPAATPPPAVTTAPAPAPAPTYTAPTRTTRFRTRAS